MCGIVGVLAPPDRFDRGHVEKATRALQHRGPDNVRVEKVWSSGSRELWFGHARLSIVDLSEAANQPYKKRLNGGPTGTIIFNGEIYNHQTLRAELTTQHKLDTTSDTEVLLTDFLANGPTAFSRANAMMAAAIFEPQNLRLTLCRDRLGKKPLYIYRSDDVLAFASELKCFKSLGLKLTFSEQSWAYYEWLRHMPGLETIYTECSKFPAASFATISLASDRIPAIEPRIYWDPFASCQAPYGGSYDEAVSDFLALLDDATNLRLQADVPVGIFLSAGIDSSLVASSVAQTRSEVTAYIVKAADPSYDESPEAIETATYLGLDYHVLDLQNDQFLRQSQIVAHHYDDPCSPLSQIPTLAISEAAAKHVKVILTGDGGDEIFLGYPWLSHPGRLLGYRQNLSKIPGACTAARALLRSPIANKVLYLLASAFGKNTATLEGKRYLLLDLLEGASPEALYDHFLCNWPLRGLEQEWRQHLGPRSLLERSQQWYPEYNWDAVQNLPLASRLAAFEMVSVMRDEILVKVDRASMAYSLEARSPLLDYRIVEFGLSLPQEYKLQDGVTKRLLRDACQRRVGPRIAKRKKTGFGIPSPPDLPPGPTPTIRWSKKFATLWKKEFLGNPG